MIDQEKIKEWETEVKHFISTLNCKTNEELAKSLNTKVGKFCLERSDVKLKIVQRLLLTIPDFKP